MWDIRMKRYVCLKDKTLLIQFIPTSDVIVPDQHLWRREKGIW